MNSVFETRFAKVGETQEHYRGLRLDGSDASLSFANVVLRSYFDDKRDQEEFLVITLNTKYNPIRIVRVTRGTLDASLVHPREVFRAAIADCASAIILAHNHPSGDPSPSPQDIATTSRLVEVGRLIGIPVVDHVIVGDYSVSMATRGLV